MVGFCFAYSLHPAIDETGNRHIEQAKPEQMRLWGSEFRLGSLVALRKVGDRKSTSMCRLGPLDGREQPSRKIQFGSVPAGFENRLRLSQAADLPAFSHPLGVLESSGFLESVGNPEHLGFLEVICQNLHPYGEPIRRCPARDADARDAGQTGGDGVNVGQVHF